MGQQALKTLIVKERARALRFSEPALLLALRAVRVGDTTNAAWVIYRINSQTNVGDITSPSTGKRTLG